MMKCEDVQPNLLDYSRDLLVGAECREIKAHLDSCAECRALLEEERAFALQLAALPVEEPANDVWALVRARTRPRAFHPMAWVAGLRRAPSRFRRTVAATALAATVAVTIYSLNAPQPSQDLQAKPASNRAASVYWSDDPLGKNADVMVELIDGM